MLQLKMHLINLTNQLSVKPTSWGGKGSCSETSGCAQEVSLVVLKALLIYGNDLQQFKIKKNEVLTHCLFCCQIGTLEYMSQILFCNDW